MRVGAVTLVTLAAGVVLVLALGGRHIVPGFRLHVEMERTGPITEGTPVRLAGRTIGEVQRVGMTRTGVVVDLWIRRSWRKHLHTNSEFFVNQARVFGEAYLEVGPPRGGAEPGPALEDGAVVRGVDPPRIDRLLHKSYQNLEAVTALLREGLPEMRDLGRALDELERTLDAAEPTPGAYGRTWAAGAELWAEGSLVLDALKASGTSLAEVQRTAGRARALLRRARADLALLSERLGRLADGVEALSARLTPERLARFGEAIQRTRRLIADVDLLFAEGEAVAALVERGEGTIGAFLHDEEVADDMKQLMKLMKTRPWVTVGHPQ
jgi:phospholipid/cholesterol/gamma-HCH transport system substrate-binding protein